MILTIKCLCHHLFCVTDFVTTDFFRNFVTSRARKISTWLAVTARMKFVFLLLVLWPTYNLNIHHNFYSIIITEFYVSDIFPPRKGLRAPFRFLKVSLIKSTKRRGHCPLGSQYIYHKRFSWKTNNGTGNDSRICTRHLTKKCESKVYIRLGM